MVIAITVLKHNSTVIKANRHWIYIYELKTVISDNGTNHSTNSSNSEEWDN